jgi:hypothetical protein
VGGPVSTPARSTTRADANTEEAKALVRRWFGEAMNSGRAATARAVRYVFSGSHTGPFQGRAATGRRIRHTENEIYRIADGQITESWGEGDWLGTFRQLDSPTPAEDEGRS